MRDSEHDGVKNVDAALEIIEYLAFSNQQLGVREAGGKLLLAFSNSDDARWLPESDFTGSTAA